MSSKWGKVHTEDEGIQVTGLFTADKGYDGAPFYRYRMGTSFAAPQVSGVAGLILSVDGALQPSQIRDIIERSADDKGPAGFDNQYGWGRLDAYRALLLAIAYQNESISSNATFPNGSRHLAKSLGKLHEIFSTGGEVIYRRSPNQGASWELTRPLSSARDNNLSPSIASGGINSIHVVWQRETYTHTYDIWYRRSTDNGTTWQPAYVLAEQVGGNQPYGPTPVIAEAVFSVGVETERRLLVAFSHYSGLFAFMSTDNGDTWSPQLSGLADPLVPLPSQPSLTGGSGLFSLVYEVVNGGGIYSLTFDGESWRGPTDVEVGTGTSFGAHPTVSIGGDNLPIAAWSGISQGMNRKVIFRKGKPDNEWSGWFVEFGEGGFIDWFYPSITYYRNTGGGYSVAIVNHTSINAVKSIRYVDDGWTTETASGSGAWANVSLENYSSGSPAFLWTDQSSSPYKIILGTDFFANVTAVEPDHHRRAVIHHAATNSFLLLEVSQARVVTTTGDTVMLSFRPYSISDSLNVSLLTLRYYLQTQLTELPPDALWLLLSKRVTVEGPTPLGTRFSWEALDSAGILLGVLDTARFSGTVAVDISAMAGRRVVLSPLFVISRIPESTLTLGIGDVFLFRSREARGAPVVENNPSPRVGLGPNYPNPFNPVTVISSVIQKNEHVVLRVYDLLGREVATLVNEERPAGRHEATFDASGLASGIYFYRMVAGEFVAVRKLVVMK